MTACILRSFVILAALLSVSAGEDSAAHAQEAAKPLPPWSVTLGLFQRSDPGSSYSTNVASRYAAVGLNYDFRTVNRVKPLVLSVYSDYFFGAEDDEYPKTKGSGADVGISGRIHLSPASSGVSPYLGLGFGPCVVHYDTSFVLFDGSVSESHTKYGFGGKLVGGIAWNRFFLEAGYHLLPEDLGIRGSGFVMQIGVHL